MLRSLSIPARCACLALAALALPAAPGAAQAYSAPASQDASAELMRHMRVLATSPKNFQALIGAGRAALDVGDTQAAAGFFGRAEEVSPASPLPQAGMGAVLVASGDPRGALTYFAKAQQRGATQASIALERGLAFDLIGDQAKAQSDYRAALHGPDGNEARRRLALSLAISRDIKGAAETIEPLLARRDPGALRINAFVLALAGDREGARRTIDAAMPGAGASFDPFFRMLPVLRADEKAAAVHLGEFPKDAAQRYAQAQPISSSPVLSIGNTSTPEPVRTAQRGQAKPAKVAQQKPVAVAQRADTKTKQSPVKIAEAPRRAVREAARPTTYMAMVRPSLDPSRYASTRRAKPTPTTPAKPADQSADPEPRPGDRLGEIAELLSTPAAAPDQQPGPAAEAVTELAADFTTPPPPEPAITFDLAPPPPEPKVETAKPKRAVSKPKVETAKAVKLADAQKKPGEKTPSEKPKAAEKKAAPTVSRHFVQLASGANADRLPTEFKKIRAKKPSLFSGRPVQVSKGKDLFRLVVGPFKTKEDSREFVNELAKAGIDGFSYTAPEGLKFEKITS